MTISEFHCHVYYHSHNRDSANSLREAVLQLAGGRLQVSTLSDGTRGPHVMPMFGIHFKPQDLPEVLGFLMKNHGPHSVLLHPETGNELLDHTHHAFWLGEKMPLNLAVLAP